MSFGTNLKIARMKLGFSRKEMADALNITVTAYANYENDEREPKFELLKQICDKLLLSADEVLGFDTEDKIKTAIHKKACDYLAAKGYFPMKESPVTFFSDDDYKYYFLGKENEYDYVAFTAETFDNLAKSLYTGTPFYAARYDEPTTGKEDKKEILTFDNYIEDFQDLEALAFVNWRMETVTPFKKNYFVFPYVYEENVKKADSFLKNNPYDESKGDEFSFKYKQEALWYRIFFDIRDFKKSITEKYGPQHLRECNTNAWISAMDGGGIAILDTFVTEADYLTNDADYLPDPYSSYRDKNIKTYKNSHSNFHTDLFDTPDDYRNTDKKAAQALFKESKRKNSSQKKNNLHKETD